jgi:catechol 2,3-dioxygenase-like lactoylglutathione lyase family enzyme
VITRFDHAIVGVRDLRAASARWRELGFDVVAGGRHTGRGTHNAIVRFGLDYVELISVYSRQEATATGGNGSVIATFLDEHEGGLLGYALATDDIGSLAARSARTGLEAVGPFAMQRRRPDGRVLGWRLLIPFGSSWLTPWPMFIQWDAADAERLSWERPGEHANGVTRVAGVRIAVRDPIRTRGLFERQLGLTFPEPFRADVDGFGIELLEPPALGLRAGAAEAPVELVLGATDLGRASSGTGIAREGGRIVIPPSRLLGVRVVIERDSGARGAA